MNSFSLGAQVGGEIDKEASTQVQELRDIFNRWTGNYSTDIREFAFILRVDAEFHTYTQEWNILGAQKARRKQDWVEVEIGIPESWWREAKRGRYKKRLIEEIERGLISMIELLRRNGRDINADSLMKDWARIKEEYLAPKTLIQ